MKTIRKNTLLFHALIFSLLVVPYCLHANSESGVVQPSSHDPQNDVEVKRIDDRIDEITQKLKNKNLSSPEKISLKKERKELKKQKGDILMKQIGIDPKVKGPVTYGN